MLARHYAIGGGGGGYAAAVFSLGENGPNVTGCDDCVPLGGKKPSTDSSIGSCVRACVTDAHAKVYVCVHMPKEVYEKEKMCVRAAEDAGS